MKQNLILLSIVLFAWNIQAQTSNESEQDAIKEIIQSAYVEGLQNEGDIEKIDAGFHPKFELRGIENENDIWILTIDQWKEKVKKGKAEGKFPKEADNKVSVRFLSVDVTGTAASAKFEFYVGEKLKYVDYMLLYKFGENWKIVNKAYYKFPEK